MCSIAATTALFSTAFFMAKRFDAQASERELAWRAGALTAMKPAFAGLTSMIWGHAGDRFGFERVRAGDSDERVVTRRGHRGVRVRARERAGVGLARAPGGRGWVSGDAEASVGARERWCVNAMMRRVVSMISRRARTLTLE